jgi:hypothetical protein
MKLGMIGAGTPSRATEGKHLAALSHYQTKLRDTPASLGDDGSAAR